MASGLSYRPNPDESNCEVRNVFLIGRTGAGKSTVANTILQRKVFYVNAVFKEGTSVPVDEAHVDIVDGHKKYTIRLFDTQGLLRPRELEINPEIVDDFKERVTRKGAVVNVNLIIFTLKATIDLESGNVSLRKHDLLLIRKMQQVFGPDVQNISALALTHCDQLEPKKSKARINYEMSKCAESELLREFMKMGIWPVEFPSASKSDRSESTTDREDLIRLIKDADQPVCGENLFAVEKEEPATSTPEKEKKKRCHLM